MQYIYFYIAIIITTVVALFTGGWFFYFFEHLKNPGIITYFDAVWFSLGTITLLGLGDVFPASIGGKLVAAFLMVYGFFFLASFATLNSFYLLQKLLKGKRHRIIFEAPLNINTREIMEDLQHISHLSKARLRKLEEQLKKIIEDKE